MKQLVNLEEYPVKECLQLLLKDKTTGKNIIFSTDNYKNYGMGFLEKDQITQNKLEKIGDEFQPRVTKNKKTKEKRTQGKAEVFTPSNICNKMNNYADNEWFGHTNVFNKETQDNKWITNHKPVKFPKNKTWRDYVESTCLEITCGEAPFLVSRYDTTTGETIPLTERVGLLDRKIRIINENTYDKMKWLKWTIKAYQSTYAYEYQGDNLLIARINLLNTFTEYMHERYGEYPDESQLRIISNIIVWNTWQMNGLTGCIPGDSNVPCKIKDWKSRQEVLFNDLKEN